MSSNSPMRRRRMRYLANSVERDWRATRSSTELTKFCSLPGPVLRQRAGQGLLELDLVRDGAFDDVLEQRPVGVTAHAALARFTGPYLQELVDDLGRAVLALLPLKDRLNGCHPRSLAAA